MVRKRSSQFADAGDGRSCAVRLARCLAVVLCAGAALQAQRGTAPPPPASTASSAASAASASESRGLGVPFDQNGWPIVAEPPPRPMHGEPPSAKTSAPDLLGAAAPQQPGAARPARDVAPPAAPGGETTPFGGTVPQGALLGSPLLQVFQATRAPGTFAALGEVTATWRLAVHGDRSEPLALRELRHGADVARAASDRLELPDGRLYRRDGEAVFAERQGMPWPTLADAAADDLAFFGLHLRLPWCFADAASFTVEGTDHASRGGERLLRIRIARRSERDAAGPQPAAVARDRFELWCDPSSGEPRELVHAFARSAGARRVLLEDWREVEGVRLPHRRVYVDAAGRPTTVLTLVTLARR